MFSDVIELCGVFVLWFVYFVCGGESWVLVMVVGNFWDLVFVLNVVGLLLDYFVVLGMVI